MTNIGPIPKIKSETYSPSSDVQYDTSDWRLSMPPVKHQGRCGSCWAFSITDVLQTYIYIERQQTLQFSEQNLIDCCKGGCNGCKGGWPSAAINYINKKGLSLAADYPYVGKTQKCSVDIQTKHYLDPSQPYMKIDSVDGLALALKSGPVSVIIDANSWDPLYQSGIFDECPQDQSEIKYNHAVICVGLSKDGAWIVRNSWGTHWGDEGHIYLPFGNSCGIADMGIVPFIL